MSQSQYILGVDAAWTFEHPSGLALIETNRSIIFAKIIASSYDDFLYGAQGQAARHKGSRPDMKSLIEKCSSLGYEVDLVAFDLPLSPARIIMRRESDAQISRKYGGLGASTHTPNATRPGPISEIIYGQMNDLGYQWDGKPDSKSFIEVYPHTAIIELFGYPYRFPYKVDKSRNYWKTQSPFQLKANIVANLNELKGKITKHIPNVNHLLPEAHEVMSTTELKSYEDCLDALICALTGYCYSIGHATRYGDNMSAIWVPSEL